MSEQINGEAIDLLSAPPVNEPARQHFFLARCRQTVQRFARENGRLPAYFVRVYGCQMNERDAEKLRGILQAAGYARARSEEEADLVLYNTCTVRENANLKVYGRLGYLGALKKHRSGMKIALCGCMMQEPKVVETIQKSYPFVDLIFGTHNIYKFAELLCAVFDQERMVIDIWKDTDKIVEDLPAQRTYPFKSGVNIMFGCNNFCTYCIVPYVRGRERSRRPEDILREIEGLVKDGVVEVMLLGQNVNSYGKNLDPPVTFAQLLGRIEQIPGLKRIRFMTSHPKDLSDELIQVMSTSTLICPHLHLPLQSGSSRLLRQMNRHYDKESYLALVDRLREKMPELSLTTDIIVGFPGETEEDFQETLDVVRRVRYDSAFTFIYSPRTGTPAATMADQVPEEVVKDRFDRLLSLVQQIGRQRCSRFEGQTLSVLVEHINEQDERLLTGRLPSNLVVHFPGSSELVGRIVQVHLTECRGFYYLGELR